MSILIYLEIILLKFCRLNENTRVNILIREKKNRIEYEIYQEENEKDLKEIKKEKEIRKDTHILEISKGYLIDLEDFNIISEDGD